MALTATWLGGDGDVVLSERVDGTVGEYLGECRRIWNEEPEGGQTVVVLIDGVLLVTLSRHDVTDGELCRTQWADGAVEEHRCHYLTDSEGAYAGTEVTESA